MVLKLSVLFLSLKLFFAEHWEGAIFKVPSKNVVTFILDANRSGCLHATMSDKLLCTGVNDNT